MRKMLGRFEARAPPEDSLTVAELEEEGHPITRLASATPVSQQHPR
jgi:hypothetical protein